MKCLAQGGLSMSDERMEMVKQWIRKGDHDLGTAKITYLHIPEYLDTVTFHCQQAIEKYLKAYLVHRAVAFRFTHDLVYLLETIVSVDPELEKYFDEVAELQSYAVEVRYPNETIFLSEKKVEKALHLAKAIRVLIIDKIGISLDYNRIIDI